MKQVFFKMMLYIIIVFVSVGCRKDFLDRNNPAALNDQNLYRNVGDFEAALSAGYSATEVLATNNVYIGDLTSDNSYATRWQPTGDVTDLDRHAFNSSTGLFNSYWSGAYVAIQRMNLLLDKLNSSNLKIEDRSRIAAEAKFVRGYAYFNLTRMFGGVPIHTQPADLNTINDIPRSSAQEVMNLVAADLNEAVKIDSLRTAAQRSKAGGRATTVGAKTLLGKLYLWQRDFRNAQAILSDVVNNSSLALVPLSTLYDPDKINNEIIFSFSHSRASGFNSPFVYNLVPYRSPVRSVYTNVLTSIGNGYGMIEPFVYKKFSSQDRRLSLTSTLTYVYSGIRDTNIYSRKYVDTLTTFNGLSASATIVLRYADALLMYAEALNENGNTAAAYQYINLVRDRAGLSTLPPGYSKQQMFEALADERQKEFMMEGDRWFDLRFRGAQYLKTTMNAFVPNSYLPGNRNFQVTDFDMLFPIPRPQIETKPILTQNPGY